jgi:hypothetical protein
MDFTPEEEKLREERMLATVREGDVMRDFAKHPGFKILERFVQSKVTDGKNEWLKAKTPEESWAMLLQNKPWQEIYDFIFHKIAKGDATSMTLRSQKQDSAS